MHRFQQIAGIGSGVALLVWAAAAWFERPDLWQPAAALAALAAVLGMGVVPQLRPLRFTAAILVAVLLAMLFPERFLHLGPIDLRNKWIVLGIVQLVMFGMGTQMSLGDFAGVARMPHGVLVGITLQFTVMPLVGFSLARLFGLPAEIAAGVVLIGSCSSGLASNVMAWMARANLPLSITLTAVSTMLAPLTTPFWMKSLAGTMVEVDAFAMMMQIVKITIVPIGAALLADYLRHATPARRQGVFMLAAFAAAWLALAAVWGWPFASASTAAAAAATVLTTLNYLLGALLFGVCFHLLTRRWPRISQRMPLCSMFGIVFFTAVTTAAGRDALLAIGGLLVSAAVLHNVIGYVLGYWLGRASGLDVQSARTVALEVGLQNGGMASGLAGAMGKLGTVGLAAAVFSPWMNVSGSLLANYWRRRPIDQEHATKQSQPLPEPS